MNPYTFPGYPGLYEALTELALDLHWSWNHATDKVWRLLDPVLWELTHNPYVVLQTASRERIMEVLEDPIARETISDLVQEKRQGAVAPAWFQQAHPTAPLTRVAYFSMEFMLSEALPIYSGGLGNVAGDHLKSASDLGIPVTGVGLLYQQGYSRQVVNADGSQQYLFPYNDPGQLPITALRDEKGEWLRIELKLPGCSLWLRTWKVQVGRVQLLLLDSNDAANMPLHRTITSELYGGGTELRLAQELVLGIGGYRLLETLGLRPEVVHLNEGHSAFALLERAAQYRARSGQTFEAALATTRAGNVFTTHTAIGGGFDCFPPVLIEQFLGEYAHDRLGISMPELLALGRKNKADASECFNVGYLAIRGSGRINAVSKVHQKVSQQILSPLFPRWPLAEVPVGAVTNGVHMPTWDSPEADRVWTETCGKDRWLGMVWTMEEHMRSVSDERLWTARSQAKQTLVEHVRLRYARQLALGGHPQEAIKGASELFRPEVLTLGFARRFATYKRPNLLLHDPARLQRLLTHAERPVQLIVAGKPHPQDVEGQVLVRQWVDFIREQGLGQQVVFLSDYDMQLTEELVQGVDVWVNTPRAPWEACGTSGMKVLVNGGLNLSVRDGWWDEAWQADVGWAITNRTDIANEVERDAAEAEQLYQILETEVIPEFYDHPKEGLPVRWINRIRESMARLTPTFSAGRAVRQYAEEFYLPAAEAYRGRAADGGRVGKELAVWKRAVEEGWSKVHVVRVGTETWEDGYHFDVQVALGAIEPGWVRAELYAEGKEGGAPVRIELKEGGAGGDGSYSFWGVAPPDRPAGDYTPRLVPWREGLSIPLECGAILWGSEG